MLQVTQLLCQARSTDGGTGRVCGRCRSCGTWYEQLCWACVGQSRCRNSEELGTVFSSSKIKPKNRVLLYTLVLSASSADSPFLLLLLLLLPLLLLVLLASAGGAPDAAAAAAADAGATALRTAGWSCSVLYFLF